MYYHCFIFKLIPNGLFIYPNSILGNDRPIEIEFGKEFSVLDYWIDGFPLKAITHGWLSSDDNCSGVFTIKTGKSYFKTR